MYTKDKMGVFRYVKESAGNYYEFCNTGACGDGIDFLCKRISCFQGKRC